LKIKKLRKWLLLPLTAVLAVSLVLAGCNTEPETVTQTQTQTKTNTQTQTQTQTETVVTSSTSDLSGTVQEGGSTSVEPLARMWAGAFEILHPNTVILIQGGGSSAGVKGAAEGIFDIGAASREVKNSELEEWPSLVTHHVAIDGVAIVVHPSNGSVSDLTLEEVRAIFANGSDDTWTVISRDEGSGTRECFEKAVMGDEEIAANCEFYNSNGAVKQKVASTENAIGYISLGFVDEDVKALSLGGIEATEANVLNETYPIWRYLNFVTMGQPTGLAKAFIDWCLSDEAQAIAEKEGFTSINKK
jgi:phosphate transport system substrate-binding protein